MGHPGVPFKLMTNTTFIKWFQGLISVRGTQRVENNVFWIAEKIAFEDLSNSTAVPEENA